MALRETKPIRRDLDARPKYTDYRDDLRDDFNGCCGYCDDSDESVDKICFHIDHFAPKKKFPDLETVYSNLVYACRFCNIRKSDHWIGDDPSIPNDGSRGFIDPCDDQYDDHLERISTGEIIPKTELGRYMMNHLNLRLIRHRALWVSRRAQSLCEEITPLIKRHQKANFPNSDRLALLQRFFDLTQEIKQYERLALD